MAFYLRRRFAEDDRVSVINDLRLERQDEVAQIDHLVLHQHGLIIVESKSVTGEIHINEQLEFTRVYGRKRTGMPSPIQQAARQGALLRQVLGDHAESLRRKLLLGLVQGRFGACPIQVLVAISDQGIIRRPETPIPELHKADQIVDEIDGILQRHRRAARPLTPSDGDWGVYSFQSDEVARITTFLVEQHTERTPTAPPAVETVQPRAAAPTPAPVASSPSYLCTHCHSTDLEIRFGRSYYFKCRACGGNTGIKNACRMCGGATRTQKRGPEFSAICSSCDHREVFFRNPA